MEKSLLSIDWDYFIKTPALTFCRSMLCNVEKGTRLHFYGILCMYICIGNLWKVRTQNYVSKAFCPDIRVVTRLVS